MKVFPALSDDILLGIAGFISYLKICALKAMLQKSNLRLWTEMMVMQMVCLYLSVQFEAAEEEDDADKKPSRKQKSLGLLCQKFLALYPDYPPPHSSIWISLDEVATSLGKSQCQFLCHWI